MESTSTDETKKPVSNVKPRSRKAFSEEKIIDVLVEEYRQSSSEIKLRLSFQQTLTNYQLVAVGAIVAIGGRFLDTPLIEVIDSPVIRYIVLLAPLVFLLLSWAHNTHDLMIIHHGKYIVGVLSPEIRRITGSANLLGSDKFLQRERATLLKRFGFLALLGQEFALHYIIPLIFFVLFLVLFLPSDVRDLESAWCQFPGWGAENWHTLLQYVLLLVSVSLYVFTIVLRVRVGFAYLKLGTE
jgi:hypothetical protein